ncbi:YihY/virulence factor BrkB family protein [Oleisolibacter albus]|uniref:YihY/virulence factor BrkB family protein n=1 Tax=Oleisolibacter albus TaxID=2171757 RepID=UPI000DF3476A|nr:YihY/virulence factor BrkB family protein [Oleisolibacter albus]
MSNTTLQDDHSDRGRHAHRPGEIPRRGWLDILKRAWSESSSDNISIVAAGVAFLSLLSLFPALSATISLYGLVADPQDITRHVESISAVLPPQGRDLLLQQLQGLAARGNDSALGFGLAVSILLALWSTSSGVKSMMTALNIAYDEQERRSFLRFTLTGLGLTLGFILMLFIAVAIVVVVPVILGILGLDQLFAWLARILRWPVLGAAIILALAVLYRFGPSRAQPRWRWITPGALVATVLWVAGSIAFSLYVSNFADYNATYGSLGAGIILLLWLYLGAYVVLLGAELNAEMEHQTMADTTTGPEQPMGRRDAHVADTLGESR